MANWRAAGSRTMPPFADGLAAGFELRLDEKDSASLPELVRWGNCGEDGAEDKCGGDEGDVHGEEDRDGAVGE